MYGAPIDPPELTGTEELANGMAFAAICAIGEYCLREGVALSQGDARAMENDIARIVFRRLEQMEASSYD
jgi:hypothetical protein